MKKLISLMSGLCVMCGEWVGAFGVQVNCVSISKPHVANNPLLRMH